MCRVSGSMVFWWRAAEMRASPLEKGLARTTEARLMMEVRAPNKKRVVSMVGDGRDYREGGIWSDD